MKRWLIALGIVLVVVAAWALRLYWLAGEFKTLTPHFTGECTAVTGAVGAEDIVIHHGAGIAFVSAADRREALAGRSPRGGIYLYDLADAAHRLRKLTPDASPEFFPHGIGLHVGADGRATLLAVNHERGKHTVEVYRWNGETLAHENRSITSAFSSRTITPIRQDGVGRSRSTSSARSRTCSTTTALASA
ncbi:MAG: hypothetical protein E6J75_03305 [Deltaproteobacteria bacterium]|nr:MAG: hypothetical protein E6J75_03305 [Deltaproteobacteria bacterium]